MRRTLTKYELDKWGEGYKFEAPEFLGYGDESGEYYDSYVAAHHAATSCSEDELAKSLHVAILDFYYENIKWLCGEGEGYHDNVVLPSYDEVREKFKELDKEWPANIATYMALDWAVEKGAEMREEVLAEREIERLQKRLESLQTPRKLALGKALLEEDRKEFG